MNRRNFLALPFAIGAGLGMRTIAASASRPGPLECSVLRLRDGDADERNPALPCWQIADCAAGIDHARITLHGFVPGVRQSPHSVGVEALFDGGAGATYAHDLYRYFDDEGIENGRPVGFDAVRGVFAGLRVRVAARAGEATRIADVRLPLAPGLYALLFGPRADIANYRFSGDRAQPPAWMPETAPGYLAFGVAAHG